MKLALMRRVNLNDSKLTIRISTASKRKALEIATKRGVSISHLVDELIRQADGGSLNPNTVRTIVSEELRKWATPTDPKGRRKVVKARST